MERRVVNECQRWEIRFCKITVMSQVSDLLRDLKAQLVSTDGKLC